MFNAWVEFGKKNHLKLFEKRKIRPLLNSFESLSDFILFQIHV